jgi:hypothetical protein
MKNKQSSEDYQRDSNKKACKAVLLMHKEPLSQAGFKELFEKNRRIAEIMYNERFKITPQNKRT